MKQLFISAFIVFPMSFASAQMVAQYSKPAIDTAALNKWPTVNSPCITNDGRYVSYAISNQPMGSSTSVLSDIEGNWRMEMPSVERVVFTEDSRKAICIKPNDSLCIITLGTSQVEIIAHVRSFRLFICDKRELIAYQLSESKQLNFLEIINKKQNLFDGVEEYWFNESSSSLVFKKRVNNREALYWMEFSNGVPRLIFQGNSVNGVVFNPRGTQIAFKSTESVGSNSAENSFWLFTFKMEELLLLASNSTSELGMDIKLGEISNFSRDGQKLFIKLKEGNLSIQQTDAFKVDIWSFSDDRLEFHQAYEDLAGNQPKIFDAVINLNNRRLIRLNYENEQILATNGRSGDNLLLKSQSGQQFERYWRKSARTSVYLVSTTDGSRKLVKDSLLELWGVGFSPFGKYVTFYDPEHKNFFAYNCISGKIVNITQRIPTLLYKEDHDCPHEPLPYDRIRWLSNDSALIVYDRFDVWIVDPSGIKPPRNFTNGFGRKNRIVFRLAMEDYKSSKVEEGKRTSLLLVAFNLENKCNGFFKKELASNLNPEMLTLGSYVYSFPLISPTSQIANSFPPVKAKLANVYVVQRMSPVEAPNFYSTTDFKVFNQVSNVHPQKSFNWLTSELIKWKTFTGAAAEGILYKPENFDSTRKYPIIVYFYERLADGLHEFKKPETCAGPINIPYFVSNGYLVFTPNVNFNIGELGESIYNSVISGVKYIMKKSWVDSTKMGIQGHSFGGYQVHYLITRTKMFAAAASSAGMADCVSDYLSVNGGGISRQFQYETAQYRLGKTLWQSPDLYIRNSPIFFADKISTPLLLNNNKGDKTVPWQQGLELFLALRRLEKPVWLIQYNVGQHQLGGKEAEDYTIRLTQFFNYYLKGTSAPKWMTPSVRTSLRGETRL